MEFIPRVEEKILKDSDSLKEKKYLLNWNGGNPKNINGKDTYFDKQSNVIKTKTDNQTLFYNKEENYTNR